MESWLTLDLPRGAEFSFLVVNRLEFDLRFWFFVATCASSGFEARPTLVNL